MNDAPTLDAIALSHGQARWLLAECLDLSDSSDSKFDAYLKHLRRNGVPFAPDETPGGPGVNIVYRYHHLMEMVLALVLHRQAILKRDIVGLLADMRDELRPLLRRAWLERESGLGAAIPVKLGADKPFPASGVWLDLGLSYTTGGALTSTGPKLLGPAKNIRLTVTHRWLQHFRPPIPISDYAKDVVRLAPEAPEFRRGRA